MIRNAILVAAAASLAAAPVSARQSQPHLQRDSAPVTSESKLGGSNLIFYIGIAAIAAAILLLSQNDDPVSA